MIHRLFFVLTSIFSQITQRSLRSAGGEGKGSESKIYENHLHKEAGRGKVVFQNHVSRFLCPLPKKGKGEKSILPIAAERKAASGPVPFSTLKFRVDLKFSPQQKEKVLNQ